VLNQLYKHTQLQESFSMIFLAVTNGQPKELAWRCHPALHRPPHRRSAAADGFPAAQGSRREHILEGLKIALDNLDAVIRIIRASNSRVDARETLRMGKGKDNRHPPGPRARTSRRKGPHPAAGRCHPELQLYRLTGSFQSTKFLKGVGEIRAKIAEYRRSPGREKKFARLSS